MKQLLGASFLFLTVILMASCSGSRGFPAESNGRSVLEHKVAEQSGGNIKVVSFKKTNGVDGGQIYQMEFQAEVEFQNSGAWAKGGKLAEHVFFKFSSQQVEQGFAAMVAADLEGWQNVRKGERQSIKDTILFQKTEKGWRSEDGQIF